MLVSGLGLEGRGIWCLGLQRLEFWWSSGVEDSRQRFGKRLSLGFRGLLGAVGLRLGGSPLIP